MTSDIGTSGGNGPGRLSGLQLLALVLLPGIIFGGFFFILSGVFVNRGLTGYLALLISIPVCLAPMELGVMLFWSARFTGRLSLSPAIAYHSRGTAADYAVWPLLLFACCGLLSIAVIPISQYLDTRLTSWLPVWATQNALLTGLAAGPPAQRSITLGLAVLLSGFVAPVVEEAYFRGFLLPRMEHWGWAAPVLNSLLFAIYHFYFPGNVPGIFVGWLPIAYVVMLKKNWRIGAVAHILHNLWAVYTVASLVT